MGMLVKKQQIASILAILAAIFFVIGLPYLSHGEDYRNALVGGILSLVLIFAAFALTVRTSSGIVGFIIIIIGAFYVYFGYQSFRLLFNNIANTANIDGASGVATLLSNISVMVDYLFATVIFGTMMVALGTMTVMRYVRGRRHLNEPVTHANTHYTNDRRAFDYFV